MRITPVVFRRAMRNGVKYLTSQPTLGCEWVVEGEGYATAKYDGRPILVEDGLVWERSVIAFEPGAVPATPAGWRPASEPQVSLGLWPGWIPMAQTDAHLRLIGHQIDEIEPGSYELIGPGLSGNPHRLASLRFVAHGKDIVLDAPRDFDGIGEWLRANHDLEGIVWMHPSGERAKIRRKDYGLEWPIGTRNDQERRVSRMGDVK